MLTDGRYAVMIVDAERVKTAEGQRDPSGAIALDLAIADGDHRGEMVTVTATGLSRDPLDLLAVPGTLTVVDGEPTVALEG